MFFTKALTNPKLVRVMRTIYDKVKGVYQREQLVLPEEVDPDTDIITENKSVYDRWKIKNGLNALKSKGKKQVVTPKKPAAPDPAPKPKVQAKPDPPKANKPAPKPDTKPKKAVKKPDAQVTATVQQPDPPKAPKAAPKKTSAHVKKNPIKEKPAPGAASDIHTEKQGQLSPAMEVAKEYPDTREGRLAKAIDKITDPKTLSLIAHTGIVPEDAETIDFMEQDLLPEYTKMLRSSLFSLIGVHDYVNRQHFMSHVTPSIIYKSASAIDMAVNSTQLPIIIAEPCLASGFLGNGSPCLAANTAFSEPFSITTEHPNTIPLIDSLLELEDSSIGRLLEFSPRNVNFSEDGGVKMALDRIGNEFPELKDECDEMFRDLLAFQETYAKTGFKDGLFRSWDTIESSNKDFNYVADLTKEFFEIGGKKGISNKAMAIMLNKWDYYSSHNEIPIFDDDGKPVTTAKGNQKKLRLPTEERETMSLRGYKRKQSIGDQYWETNELINTFASLDDMINHVANGTSPYCTEDAYNDCVDKAKKLMNISFHYTGDDGRFKDDEAKPTERDFHRFFYANDAGNDKRRAVMANLALMSLSHRTKMAIEVDGHDELQSKYDKYSDQKKRVNHYTKMGTKERIMSHTLVSPEQIAETRRIATLMPQNEHFYYDYSNVQRACTTEQLAIGGVDFDVDAYLDAVPNDDSDMVCKKTGYMSSEKSATPVRDIAFSLLTDFVNLEPMEHVDTDYTKWEQDKGKTREKLMQKLGYKSYDDCKKTATWKKYHEDPDLTGGGKSTGDLQEQAKQKAQCSVGKASEDASKQVLNEIQSRWTDKDPDDIYGVRTYKINRGVFEIKDSPFDEPFAKRQKETGDEIQRGYHGTSYGGTCGVMHDGQFSLTKQVGGKYAGSMLGKGTYVALNPWKNVPYVGSGNYAYKNVKDGTERSKDNKADGVLMVTDFMRGKSKDFNSIEDAQKYNMLTGSAPEDELLESVACTEGTSMGWNQSLKEYELAICKNELMRPRYIVDMGVRHKERKKKS